MNRLIRLPGIIYKGFVAGLVFEFFLPYDHTVTSRRLTIIGGICTFALLSYWDNSVERM
jgi:hypothetical protein